jgi:uncharacterized protein involved in outer membrane biogenesis
MTEDAQRRQRNKKRLGWTAAAIALVLAVLIVPPLVSISRYKSRITQLVSASLGRPVRLSSVELRLLPRPGFVLTDLTVDEDPAFGAEPVLHANTVTAAVRLFSLWRGRLEISRISVDEASLNLVRSSAGRWNLDPIFRTAAQARGGRQGKALQLPYLEATDSRINIKNGLEKLPYSLVGADLSFWQENPGDWRLRLRAQPARTDVTLDLADTGIVQVEADFRRAAQLHNMPVHLDVEWRDAQLGQLSRLVLGSDPGWRGDLRGNLQLDGTAESASVKTRLQATGVHRAEFAPVTALDFDANCNFVYHYSARSLEQLACDSPLGDGRIHLTGTLPASGAEELHAQLQRIPAQAGLDMLRTVRSGIDATLQAAGTVSGELSYDSSAGGSQDTQTAKPQPRDAKRARQYAIAAPAPALTGNLALESFALSGDSLKHPIQIAKAVLEPAAPVSGEPEALGTQLTLPSGGDTPLEIGLRLTRRGYLATLRGPVSFVRLRELAIAVGAGQFGVLANVAGEAPVLDLTAEGPWLPRQDAPVSSESAAGARAAQEGSPRNTEPHADQVTGTVTLHNTNWKTDALASPVEIAQGTLHLGPDTLRWDPVTFSYGPLKGNGTLVLPVTCAPATPCVPVLHLEFDDIDAGTVQAALLGARKPGTVVSDLIARFTSASTTPWPLLDATLQASTLTLGPVKLQKAQADLQIKAGGADIVSLEAGLLGGKLHAAGTVTAGDKPAYAIEASVEKADAAAVCQLVGLRCKGGAIAAEGKVEVAGFSAADLAASAKGSLHFEWRRGTVTGDTGLQAPAELAHFALWTGDAGIAKGAITVEQNTVTQGAKRLTVSATVPLADPPHIRFAAPGPGAAAKR